MADGELRRTESEVIVSPHVFRVRELVSTWFSRGSHGRSRRVGRGELKRIEILWSILAAETQYGKELKYTYKNYYKPIQASNLISQSQLNILFCNINEFRKLHKEFRASLIAAAKNWSQNPAISPTFQLIVDKISIFETQAEKHIDTMQLLQLQSSNIEFQRILKRRHTSGKKDLYVLLQGPLYIIARYTAYLEEFQTFTNRRHTDFVTLPDILNVLRDTDVKLKEAQSASDDAEKIMFIVSHVQYAQLSIFSSKSHYLLEGEMTLLQGEKKEPVYAYLFSDVLFLVSEASTLTHNASMRFIKMFSQNKIRHHFHSSYKMADIADVNDEQPEYFSLISRTETITFSAETPDKNLEWSSLIKSLIIAPLGRTYTL